ncbi:unnamed protein product [Toxocara canis]|uniref:BZIP domain-containing protein n=1 Tax=Toxocara canis TaxID=6265 RepID=A0A183V7W7_TOXCA|nr:unnamed protein product [Toxocara canis]
MCSSSIRTFAAMCGASQPAGQQGQAGIQAQQEAATRQELFRTCRRTLVPIEKDFERGLHIRKLRLGPTCRYKILKPQFEDSKYRYSKVATEMQRRNFLEQRTRVPILEFVSATSSTKSVDNLSRASSTRRSTRAVPCPTQSSPYRAKIVLIRREKTIHSASCTPGETASLVHQQHNCRTASVASQSVLEEADRTSYKLRSATMSLEPPRYDVDELGPLLDEFNPLSEFYVAPRYDADLRPLVYGDDFLHMTLTSGHFGSQFHKTDVGEDLPLAGPCQLPATDVHIMPEDMSAVGLSPAAGNSQQPDTDELDPILMESFIDLAELDQYLNEPEPSNGSPAAVVPAQSAFDAIIREDHYEDAVAVSLDHPYGTTAASSTNADSMDLDPSILNEFFAPLPSMSSTGPCESEALNVSPTYLETFTNLEPYLQHRAESLTPPEGETTCDLESPSSAKPSFNRTTAKSRSATTSDASYATGLTRLETPDEYRRRRDKNNIASQKSRRKRQQKFHALKEEELQLKKRNTELLATVCDLERQVNNLKEIMMKAITG